MVIAERNKTHIRLILIKIQYRINQSPQATKLALVVYDVNRMVKVGWIIKLEIIIYSVVIKNKICPEMYFVSGMGCSVVISQRLSFTARRSTHSLSM